MEGVRNLVLMGKILYVIFILYVIIYTVYLITYTKKLMNESRMMNRFLLFINNPKEEYIIYSEDKNMINLFLKYGIYDESIELKIPRNKFNNTGKLSIENISYDEISEITFDLISINENTSEKIVLAYSIDIIKDKISTGTVYISTYEGPDYE